MSALQQRLTALEADQLDAFLERQKNPSGLDRGFMMNGVGSPAWDAYAKNLNNQGEIAKIKSIMSGGSGELNVRSGQSMNDDEYAAPPPSINKLGKSVYDVPADDAINDSTGQYKLALYNKKMADLAAGTAQSEAARRAAVVSTDPRAGYVEDQARVTQGLDTAGRKAQFEREQVLPDVAADTEAKLWRDREVWNDTTQDWMRRDKRELALAPIQARTEGATDVATIKAQATTGAAGTTADSRQNVAAMQQANANLRAAMTNYIPGNPTSEKAYRDAIEEVRRLQSLVNTPGTPGPDLNKSFAAQGITVR
jgi:hypothetical protein